MQISRKALTAHEQIPGLTKTEFIKCPLRIVITDLFMFECDKLKRKLMKQNLHLFLTISMQL